ncbi:MAG TPA: hypothetical protein DCY03_15015, partial [Planctomycetaceae bacterium]|nr:hypothetical protein [Planctomycetaceae bacterium]
MKVSPKSTRITGSILLCRGGFALLALTCLVPVSSYGQTPIPVPLPIKEPVEKQTGNEVTVLYAAPTSAELKSQLESWVADQKVKDPSQLKAIASQLVKLESVLSAEEKLDIAIRIFSNIDGQTADLVRVNQFSDSVPQFSSPPLLTEGKAETFYLANLRYFIARNLTQFRLVDPALDIFNSINPEP